MLGLSPLFAGALIALPVGLGIGLADDTTLKDASKEYGSAKPNNAAPLPPSIRSLFETIIAMAISIDHELRCWDRDIYSVTFFNREIDTLVTHTAEMVEAWRDNVDCALALTAEEMLESLFDFLVDENNTFVGVGIDRDVEKLYDEYDLEVENTVDLRRLASKRMRRRELRNTGLAYLAKEVPSMEYEKPKKITLSKWDKPRLSHKSGAVRD
ncbi:hypothetical protein Nepgr_020501 [Nepenthes gracilis]|uniref:3'-5' exonuclease domain-containing protein n=1 Tax=Nepenthes gracilis TaxID=150966 RepID=A0AAD3XWC0_NEPGR|nr:hypothetical protein Nepgr_020501 [Nepenthes gracilis]